MTVLRPGFSAHKTQKALVRQNVIIGYGVSWRDPKEISHVAHAMDVPPELLDGILHVSLSDDTVKSEVLEFVTILIKTLASEEVLQD